MGLLPDVAADLGVSIDIAGLLITGYAMGVVIARPSWPSSPTGCRARPR